MMFLGTNFKSASMFLILLPLLPYSGVSFQTQTLPLSQRHALPLRMAEDKGAEGMKITVVGGTGFVGSRVCRSLIEKGAVVKSVSKTGNIPAWCKDDDWTNNVEWIAADLLEGTEDSLDAAIGAPDCLVSCLGVIGNDPEVLRQGNGKANCAAFASAKRGGKVKRAVFVSVSSEVVACQENWLPDFFEGYFSGKKMAEECALDAVGGDSSQLCLVKPTFIYGGDSFGFLPPRVTTEYGSFIEELLFKFKLLADLTPGLIKVALRPPSSVNAVADACVSAAIDGDANGKVLEGAAEINEITNQPPAEGLTNAIKWATEKTGEFIEWTKEEVPKIMAKLEEAQKK